MQLKRILIYPVKSLAGIDLQTSGFGPDGGLENDRRWCLVLRDAEITPDSVYMTKYDKTSTASAIARTVVHHGSSIGAMSLELDGNRSPEFSLPNDEEQLAAWCSEQYRTPLRLEESTTKGYTDAAVYCSDDVFATMSGPTVISTATINYLSEKLSLSSEDVQLRLRANLLVHDDTLEPFGEEELTEIQLGEVRLHVAGRVPRCPVPARDTTTGEYERAFTRSFIDAKAETRIGAALDRGDLYSASVFTRVLTPDASLVVTD